MSELSLSKVWNAQPGWYRGDFHTHTTASDGKYSPEELAALAREQGLDFFAITDHNTLNAYPLFGDDPGLLIIPGVEVTLDIGHWNVFGIPGWQDWMEGICGDHIHTKLADGRTPSDVMRTIAALGLPNSINHPLLKPWEWRDESTQLDYVHFLEIWNDPYWPDNTQANPAAVALWTEWLNAGYRVTAIGGSDFHFLPGDHKKYPGEIPGLPATVVGADELSGVAILTALQRHQVYVTSGPQVRFEAHAGEQVYPMGAEIGNLPGEISFHAEVWDGAQAIEARLVENGVPVASAALKDGQGTLNNTPKAMRSKYAWFRLEVLGEQENLLAITNPIFIYSF
jgi:hypothetical protein